MSSKRKSRRAKKRSEKRLAAVETVREQLEVTTLAGQVAVPRVEEASAVSASAISTPAVSAPAVSVPDDEVPDVEVPEDEHSVPPVDLDARFFTTRRPSWPPPSHGTVPETEEDLFGLDARDRRVRSLTPLAIARRARFARYVRVAVGVSGMLCIAAIVKTLTHDDGAPLRRPAAVAVQPPQLPDPAAPVLPEPQMPAAAAAVGDPALDGGAAKEPKMRPGALPAEGLGGARPLRVR
jgi:hypothetical protein